MSNRISFIRDILDVGYDLRHPWDGKISIETTLNQEDAFGREFLSTPTRPSGIKFGPQTTSRFPTAPSCFPHRLARVGANLVTRQRDAPQRPSCFPPWLVQVGANLETRERRSILVADSIDRYHSNIPSTVLQDQGEWSQSIPPITAPSHILCNGD